MEFVVGTRYMTRDGAEVRVYATDGEEPYPIHGAFMTDNGWQYNGWTKDGTHHSDCYGKTDIVSEWKPPFEFDWSCLALWDKYVAKDCALNTWHSFMVEPLFNKEKQWWMQPCLPNAGAFIPEQFSPVFCGTSEESLHKRPDRPIR